MGRGDRDGRGDNPLQLLHERHPVLADVVLVGVLVLLIYGAIWFDLPQFFVTDWEVSVTGSYPGGF